MSNCFGLWLQPKEPPCCWDMAILMWGREGEYSSPPPPLPSLIIQCNLGAIWQNRNPHTNIHLNSRLHELRSSFFLAILGVCNAIWERAVLGKGGCCVHQNQELVGKNFYSILILSNYKDQVALFYVCFVLIANKSGCPVHWFHYIQFYISALNNSSNIFSLRDPFCGNLLFLYLKFFL